MTVFEYIIDTLPRKFEYDLDSDNKGVLVLDFGGVYIIVKDKGGYFVVDYRPDKAQSTQYYTQTDNKHELLGLLVELTK